MCRTHATGTASAFASGRDASGAAGEGPRHPAHPDHRETGQGNNSDLFLQPDDSTATLTTLFSKIRIRTKFSRFILFCNKIWRQEEKKTESQWMKSDGMERDFILFF